MYATTNNDPNGPGSPCEGCRDPRCRYGCYPALVLLLFTLFSIALAAAIGCVPAPQRKASAPFEVRELDACLAVLVDQSGSFAAELDERGYAVLLELMDRFFTDSAGGEARVVIGQLSGRRRAMLFEGRPDELRARFKTPEELAAFLKRESDPASSPVYEATTQAIEYVTAAPGVTDRTRLVTVILSDLEDNTPQPEREAVGRRMVRALEAYREVGGGLALYCVAPEQAPRWQTILSAAGFGAGEYVIESTLVARPQLPRFD